MLCKARADFCFTTFLDVLLIRPAIISLLLPALLELLHLYTSRQY